MQLLEGACGPNEAADLRPLATLAVVLSKWHLNARVTNMWDSVAQLLLVWLVFTQCNPGTSTSCIRETCGLLEGIRKLAHDDEAPHAIKALALRALL